MNEKELAEPKQFSDKQVNLMRLSIRKEVEHRMKVDDADDRRNLFLSVMILKSEIRVERKAPTACAYLTKFGKPIISVNPEFWDSLKDRNDRFTLLVHELFHLMHNHFIRFNRPSNESEAMLQNIAMDCAINQHISRMKSGKFAGIEVINYGTFKKFVGSDVQVEELKHAEYYFDLIKSKMKPNHGVKIHVTIGQPQKGEGEGDGGQSEGGEGEGEKGEGQGGEGEEGEGQGMGQGGNIPFQGDGSNGDVFVEVHYEHFEKNHSEGEAQNNNLANELFKDLVKQTMSQVGVSPNDFGIEVEEGHDIDWKRFMKLFLMRNQKANLRRLRTRKNKRFGWTSSKRTADKIATIDVLVDTSGSMCGELPIIFDEILHLAKIQKNTRFNVFAVDTSLYFLGQIKNKKDATEVAKKIQGGGGTDFTEALVQLERHNKRKNGIIFLTDTYGNFPEKKPRYDMFILCTEEPSYLLRNVPWAKSVAFDISSIIEKAHERRQAS